MNGQSEPRPATGVEAQGLPVGFPRASTPCGLLASNDFPVSQSGTFWQMALLCSARLCKHVLGSGKPAGWLCFDAAPDAASERLTDSPEPLPTPPGLLTHVCRAR